MRSSLLWAGRRGKGARSTPGPVRQPITLSRCVLFLPHSRVISSLCWQTAAPPGQEGRRPGSQTAPSTPRVGKKVQSADQPKRTKTPQPASAMPSGTASRASEADASFTTLADVSTETASTQAEIHIGPQPLPYVYHRRSQSITHDLAPIGELRDRNQRYRRTSSAALTDIPSSVNPPKAIESAVVDVVDDSGLSAWRRDQLKHMKPAKLVNEGQVKTLASLHGPLSLPYARNPR